MPALLLALFFISTPLHAEPTDDQVWTIVRPRQCMSNPWEKAWMKKNKNQASKYPRADEFDVIKQFFAAKNVPILEMRFKPYVKGDPYCQTCECNRGDTLFLLIDGHNVPRMVRLGYTERMAARDVPHK